MILVIVVRSKDGVVITLLQYHDCDLLSLVRSQKVTRSALQISWSFLPYVQGSVCACAVWCWQNRFSYFLLYSNIRDRWELPLIMLSRG